MQQRKIELPRARDFGEIISDSIHFIRQNFKPLFKPMLYICAAFVLLSIATGIAYQVQMVSLYGLDRGARMGGFDSEMLSSPANMLGSMAAYLFFYLLAYTSITLVALCYIKLYYEGGHQAPSKEAVWETFKAYVVKFFLISLVFAVLQVLAFALCLLPGVYLFPILSLAMVAVVLEDASLSDALSRASSLVKDHWWKTFGALLVVGIIISMSSYLFALPAQVLMLSGLFIGDSSSLVMAGSLINVVIQSLAIFLYALFVVAAALCYFSLREQKEGLGLMGRIEAFGETGGANPPHPDEEY